MGNCCKKKKDESLQSNDKENNENNNNNKSIILIKDNKGGKNFQDNEEIDKENNSKLQYNGEDFINIDSKTRFKEKEKEFENTNDNYMRNNKKLNKNIQKYEKIIFDYLKLKENISNDNKLILYIINKKDNEDIISIYRSVIESKEYKLLKEKTTNKKKKEIICKALNEFFLAKTYINNEIRVYNYDQCKDNLINNQIDVADNNFIKGMQIKVNKENETKYIENYNKDNLILEFLQKKKKVRIEIRNHQYYLRELLDEINKSLKNSIFDDNNNNFINDEINIKENKFDFNENKKTINNDNLKNNMNESNDDKYARSLNKIKIEMNNN